MKKYFLCFVFLLTAGFIFTSCGNQESEETYSVTVKKCTGGRVTASPSSSVKAGQRVTLKVVPDDGYEEGSVTVKSGQFKSVDYDGDTATFIMPSEDVTVSALFNKVYVWDTYTVTLEQCEKGVISADKSEGVDCSQYVTVTFTPDEGYVTDTKAICVKDEEGNEVIVTAVEKSADIYKFKMPKRNIRVCAGFKVDDSWSYPVPVSAGRQKIGDKIYDLVYFGVFPQTVAPQDLDESAFDDSRKVVMGGLTYCYNTQDKNYYCCVQENAYGRYNSYSDGTAVHRSSDNQYRWFKVEPIKWRVLETYSGEAAENEGTAGNALLFSDLILDSGICFYPRAYDSGGYYGTEFDNRADENYHYENGVKLYPNSYRASSMRAYLNGQSYYNLKVLDSSYVNKGFLQMAFTDSALELLQGKKIEDGVVDKIFLLSNEELQLSEYSFSNGQTDSIGTRKKNGTDFSLARYLDGTTWYTYTIKNIGRATQTTPYVSSSGYLSWQKDVYTSGVKVYIRDYGIVPACIVKIGN